MGATGAARLSNLIYGEIQPSQINRLQYSHLSSLLAAKSFAKRTLLREARSEERWVTAAEIHKLLSESRIHFNQWVQLFAGYYKFGYFATN